MNTLGKILHFEEEATYNTSPLEIYNALPDRSNTVLLESAQISTKKGQLSLLMAKACVRIYANIHTVSMKALNENGKNCLNHMAQILQQYLTEKTHNQLRFTFAKTGESLEEYQRVKTPNILHVLRAVKENFTPANQKSHGEKALFMPGIFSFDLLESVENIPSVPVGYNTCPSYIFYISEILMTFNHIEQCCTVSGTVFSGKDTENTTQDVKAQMHRICCTPPRPLRLPMERKREILTPNVNIPTESFKKVVKTCKDYIKRGDAFQIVPSRVFSLPCEKPIHSYARLKSLNPSPYMFYVKDQDFTVFGASPESALKYIADSNIVSLYPIAGTRPRGKYEDGTINKDLDAKLELEMRMDAKEVSEHIMLVDLARNDIARISMAKTCEVVSLMHTDKYSHVQHLVSKVQGHLKAEYDCLHAYQLCMNMGTLTGAPKIQASHIIREVEKIKRGSYGGAVGYINGKGDMDTCIIIRSAFVKNAVAYIGAGCGVVLHSDEDKEAEETYLKALPVMKAIAKAHGFTLA